MLSIGHPRCDVLSSWYVTLQRPTGEANSSEGPSCLSPYFTKRQQSFELSEFVDPGGQIYVVELTHYLGHSLTVYVSTFVPQDVDESGGDKISHTWTKSVGTHYLEMPPYCLVNLEQIRANMRQYMWQTRGITLRLRTGTCELTWYTIHRAIDFATSRRVNSLTKPISYRMKSY